MRDEVGEYEQQFARLTIVAPCDGLVVDPIKRSTHRSNGRKWKSLPAWDGSPLDLQNRGSFLDAGTHLLSIAPDARYEAILRIDEPDRSEFAAGQDVKIKVEHLPGMVLRSKIHRLTRFASEPETVLPHVAPTPYSATSATPPANSVHSDHGVHEAAVLMPHDVGSLIPGVYGQARILVTHRSAAEWLWRYVCSTFEFLG
jgi:putative peptide zinc metalloprotease protein